MLRRALITGGAGFVGQWLARALMARGCAVTSVSHAAHPAHRVLDAGEFSQVRWIAGDVRDGAQLERVVAAERPDAIFHLAGVSYVPAATESPVLAYEINVLGCANLLGGVRRLRAADGYDPVVLVVGSGEQYGRHEAGELPLTEAAEQRPLTVYAATKAAQEVVALQAARGDGLRVIATRSFNHSGPGHAPHFLLPALVARATALPRRGGQLALGNDFVTRDYLHVADVVDAYVLLAERGVPGEAYNVCSGSGVTVRSLAEHVLQRLGITAEIVTDPALVRPVDVPVLIGSPVKVQSATGWHPRHSREAIVDDLIRSVGNSNASS